MPCPVPHLQTQVQLLLSNMNHSFFHITSENAEWERLK